MLYNNIIYNYEALKTHLVLDLLYIILDEWAEKCLPFLVCVHCKAKYQVFSYYYYYSFVVVVSLLLFEAIALL